MDSDLREVLSLLVQLGQAAGRILTKHADNELPREPAITLIKAASEALPEVAPEPAPAPEPVEPEAPSVVVPEDFAIGQARNYRDKAPPSRRWYTPHARTQLMQRYPVTPSMAYRTLQHVSKSIQERRALYLYGDHEASVWAVNIFGLIGFVVTDSEAHTIVTFLPQDARNDPQIVKNPRLRSELQAFENEARCQRQGKLVQQAKER